MILIYSYINQLIMLFNQKRFGERIPLLIISVFITVSAFLIAKWGFVDLSFEINELSTLLEMKFNRNDSLLESNLFFILLFSNIIIPLRSLSQKRLVIPYSSIMLGLMYLLDGVFLKSTLLILVAMFFNYEKNYKLIIPSVMLLVFGIIEEFLITKSIMPVSILVVLTATGCLYINQRNSILYKENKIEFFFINIMILNIINSAWLGQSESIYKYLILFIPVIIHLSTFKKDKEIYNLMLVNLTFLMSGLGLINSYSLFIILVVVSVNYMFKESRTINRSGVVKSVDIKKLKLFTIPICMIILYSGAINLWTCLPVIYVISIFCTSVFKQEKINDHLDAADVFLVIFILCALVLKEVLNL